MLEPVAGRWKGRAQAVKSKRSNLSGESAHLVVECAAARGGLVEGAGDSDGHVVAQ